MVLEKIPFDNLALRSLPVKKVEPGYIGYVEEACFAKVDPSPLENPKVIAVSTDALSLLDLSEITNERIEKDEEIRKEVEKYLSGNEIIPGSSPAAHCYCGYQFGYFSGQLGDGAAMYLGELVNKKLERWELQFKGSGITPFSRGADGRKVLRSSIREFLCSEACYFLGIPTTRAGSLITSDSLIERDPQYTRKVIMEKCSVITRIAPTFIRFGSFEIFKGKDEYTGRSGPSPNHEKTMLPIMLKYLIQNFFPQFIINQQQKLSVNYEGCNLHLISRLPNHPLPLTIINDENKEVLNEEVILQVYEEIIRRTAKLVSMWQCFGFCHGVLNTDNMSILGLTIDYGPFAFMESFDQKFICNGSDHEGRYNYESQVEICKWNCMKLGVAWQSVLPLERSSKSLNDIYLPTYQYHYYETMKKKLGLIECEKSDNDSNLTPEKIDQEKRDRCLIQRLLETMETSSSDFTNVFRALSELDLILCLNENEIDCKEIIRNQVAKLIPTLLKLRPLIDSLKKKVKLNFSEQELGKMIAISKSNPFFLRMAGISPEMVEKEIEKLEKLKKYDSLSQSEIDQRDSDNWNNWLVEYVKRIREDYNEMKQRVSPNIESEQILKERYIQQRKEVMGRINPSFILRNHIAQRAIERAENGDFSEVKKLLSLLRNPFDRTSNLAEDTPDVCARDTEAVYYGPDWSHNICVTCSS